MPSNLTSSHQTRSCALSTAGATKVHRSKIGPATTLPDCEMGASCAGNSGNRVTRGALSNRTVRSQPISPERGSFKPPRFLASANLLFLQAFDNRTKTGVVRSRQRKGPVRDGKQAEMGLAAATRVRTNGRRSPRSAGFRPLIRSGKRMSRLGVLAEGKGFEPSVRSRVERFAKPSLCRGRVGQGSWYASGTHLLLTPCFCVQAAASHSRSSPCFP
jgi:hypothetical protein